MAGSGTGGWYRARTSRRSAKLSTTAIANGHPFGSESPVRAPLADDPAVGLLGIGARERLYSLGSLCYFSLFVRYSVRQNGGSGRYDRLQWHPSPNPLSADKRFSARNSKAVNNLERSQIALAQAS